MHIQVCNRLSKYWVISSESQSQTEHVVKEEASGIGRYWKWDWMPMQKGPRVSLNKSHKHPFSTGQLS